MKRIACIAPLLALVAPCAQAQQWLPDPALVATAITAQPSVQAAMGRVDSAGAQARARAVGPHEVEVGVIRQVRQVDAIDGDRRYGEYEAQVGRAFRWPGKAALDRQIGEHGKSAAELRLDDVRHQVARNLLDRWMGWLRADELAREAEARAESLSNERRALGRSVELGDAAQKDLDLLDVDFAQSEAARVTANGDRAAARAALENDFPGLPLPQRVPSVTQPGELSQNGEAWIARIVGRSHEIAAAEANAAKADALAARARADRLPDPTIGLRVLHDRGGAERALGLVVSFPIGGRYRSALADAESANASALHSDSLAMLRDIQREAEQTVRLAIQQRENWLAQQRALAASREATRRVRRGWELGELPLSDWLLAERMYRQIALAEAAARVDAERARLRVLVDSHELWHDE
ncbi:MAG: TolC family protein [Xanthomonadales bacterium]|nr:TolC family protein [Xanthomonadales bacterium]MCB1578740.1 TolC family protein [Xanthomonadales bacterium]